MFQLFSFLLNDIFKRKSTMGSGSGKISQIRIRNTACAYTYQSLNQLAPTLLRIIKKLTASYIVKCGNQR